MLFVCSTKRVIQLQHDSTAGKIGCSSRCVFGWNPVILEKSRAIVHCFKNKYSRLFVNKRRVVIIVRNQNTPRRARRYGAGRRRTNRCTNNCSERIDSYPVGGRRGGTVSNLHRNECSRCSSKHNINNNILPAGRPVWKISFIEKNVPRLNL